MENSDLRVWIERFRKNDGNAFPCIYAVFARLILHYADKLAYEDAVQELNIFFLELLEQLRLGDFLSDSSSSLQRYIAVSIRNHYIYLSEKSQKYKSMNGELFETSGAVTPALDDRIWLTDAFRLLSEKQKNVLFRRYICGYSDAEISEQLGISRQAVNRVKNRGLAVLRKAYPDLA